MSKKLKDETPGNYAGVFVPLHSFLRAAEEKVSESHGNCSDREPSHHPCYGK